jgi:hypothetical protein
MSNRSNTVSAGYINIVASDGNQASAKSVHGVIEKEAKNLSKPFESLLAQTFVDVAALYSTAEKGPYKQHLAGSFNNLVNELVAAYEQNHGIVDDLYVRPVLTALQPLEDVFNTDATAIVVAALKVPGLPPSAPKKRDNPFANIPL